MLAISLCRRLCMTEVVCLIHIWPCQVDDRIVLLLIRVWRVIVTGLGWNGRGTQSGVLTFILLFPQKRVMADTNIFIVCLVEYLLHLSKTCMMQKRRRAIKPCGILPSLFKTVPCVLSERMAALRREQRRHYDRQRWLRLKQNPERYAQRREADRKNMRNFRQRRKAQSLGLLRWKQ